MPLSELYRSMNGSMNGKKEPLQHKPANVSYIPNDEFMELICEKGQIMMQGQSSKNKKTPVSSFFQFQPPKVQGKESVLNIPMSEMGLNQDHDHDEDDTVPWLDYALDDYNSNLLTELSGVTVHEPVHEPPMHNGLNVLEKRVHKDPNSVTGLDQYSAVRNKASNASYLEKLVQNQDSALPHRSTTFLNFSHFSRPAALARATVQSHEPLKQTGQPGSASNQGDEPHCVEKCSNDVNEGNEGKEASETVKSNEPVGVCSSVCSGNSGERASNDMTRNCKRKFRDSEDFECQSQDAEEKSFGAKTAAAASRGTSGSKRSRAAEVHNLSERRRRDRINEKMRALQELIPNCNKVDKASMLDEAIEYLKTLQLQVQIMSMGPGLCMPPMMFSPGLQHMHPHFSPVGMGYGMGMGMGMGMRMEMNGGQHMFPYSSVNQRSPPLYGHISQGMPILLPQPPIPAPQRVATQLKDPIIGPGPGPIPDKNPLAVTHMSSQAQVANKSSNQSVLVDHSDRLLEGGCSTHGKLVSSRFVLYVESEFLTRHEPSI